MSVAYLFFRLVVAEGEQRNNDVIIKCLHKNKVWIRPSCD